MTTATSDLSRLFARQIDEKKLNLPTMPGTAAEVMELCQLEDTDAAKLSAVIHRDQTIASHVLRVANSAAYAGQMPCASLQQAVSRLGMQLITEVAMAVSVRGRIFGNKTCAELLAALWKHSVLTGFYTKEIARLRRRNVEIAFLCGLLHDVGKAVLLDNVDRVLGKNELTVPVGYLLNAVHEQHVEAGALLASEWKLPEQIAEAIGHHHEYVTAPRFADMAMTVCLADQLSHLVAPGPFGKAPDEEELRAHPVLEGLNLYPDQLEELINKRDRALLVTESLR
ncbi:MAG: HDOD domain-containing protein [Planctomycetes bacterium]|nr:HDOD domain-containing protein [Planctomycetota bacterium]MCB9885594.1 HDOD domain-containing protein [Planctomycetota bacterium]